MRSLLAPHVIVGARLSFDLVGQGKCMAYYKPAAQLCCRLIGLKMYMIFLEGSFL